MPRNFKLLAEKYEHIRENDSPFGSGSINLKQLAVKFAHKVYAALSSEPLGYEAITEILQDVSNQLYEMIPSESLSASVFAATMNHVLALCKENGNTDLIQKLEDIQTIASQTGDPSLNE